MANKEELEFLRNLADQLVKVTGGYYSGEAEVEEFAADVISLAHRIKAAIPQD